MHESTLRRRIGKLAAIAGFLALAGAALAAHRAPARGYELSPYAATPVEFWIGLAAALLVALAVAIGTRGGLRRAGLLLGASSVMTMLALPLVRGYHFYGGADSLTHLGWMREMAAGELGPFGLFYPGTHLVSVFIHDVVGVSLRRASMLMVLAFALVFVVFVALAVRTITSGQLGVVVGAVSALLFLPINNINIQLLPHPISQATLFAALMLFLLFKYLRLGETDPPAGRVSAVGVLLGLTSVAVVLYHPQEAVVMILLFGAVAAAQFLHRRGDGVSFADGHRPMYAQTGILLAAFLLWTPQFEGFYGQGELVVNTVVGFVLGGQQQVAGVVGQRGASLTQIGSGLDEIFVKLFLVSAIYAGLAGLLMLSSLAGRLDERASPADAATRYMAYGFAVVLPVAALHLVGNLSKLFFRYTGTIMLIATVIGAVALFRLAGDEYGVRSTRALLGLALVVMLMLSLLTVFPSPYAYQASAHVSETQMEGYEAAFAQTDEDASFAGVRWNVWRYRHAVEGVSGAMWSGDTVPPDALRSNVSAEFNGSKYVVVTEFDRQRETIAYRGVRYTQSDFAGIRTQPDVHRVRANGEVDLYYAE
jgi:hypothetical protein